jgi:hypothetical protein
MPIPKPPTTVALIPSSTTTSGVLPVPPNTTVVPIPGPADTSGLAFILYDGAAYAPRNSVTTDPERVVVWIGPVSPAVDGTYALDEVDVWWNTGA